jgi:hypothetical protein
MVNIDTVYQRVLALANKEQRGYITPQEFNLFANQAQMDIFEQYFYDLNQFRRIPGNDTVHSDMVTLIEDKIDFFRTAIGQSSTSQFAANGPGFILPSNLYRLEMVRIGGVICERLNAADFNAVRNLPLTKPTTSRPIYTVRGGNTIILNDGDTVDFTQSSINMVYIKIPTSVSWNSNPALPNVYDNSTSINFELHASEEPNLVLNILKLAGIAMKDPNLYQLGASEEAKDIQQEKQ